MPAVFFIGTETSPGIGSSALSYSLIHEIIYSDFIADMGDAFEQRVNKNISFGPRADGEGNVVSYKGINRFTIRANVLAHVNASSTDAANKFWAFYKARLGAYDAFYFYNPGERPNNNVDLTGIDQLGRYLVRFEENKLSRELFTLKLYNYGISLIEVRA